MHLLFHYIQWYFERTYELTCERNINKAIRLISSENRYHPVKQFLESLEWDGISWIDYLLSKFLGVDDNAYCREAMHLLMQAMIHRTYVPGCKLAIALLIATVRKLIENDATSIKFKETISFEYETN